jgi:hypothetical protein
MVYARVSSRFAGRIRAGVSVTESYQERLRRAANLPTAAEEAQQVAEKRRREQEQAAERLRRQQEAEADRPRRQALAKEFNEKVVPILYSAFVGAQPEFQHAKRTLSEEVSAPTGFLFGSTSRQPPHVDSVRRHGG